MATAHRLRTKNRNEPYWKVNNFTTKKKKKKKIIGGVERFWGGIRIEP